MLSRHPVRRLVYLDPKHDEPAFVEWVAAELTRGGHAVTLGYGEDVTYLPARHKPRFAAYTSIPLVDLGTFMVCRDKSLTMKAATACGVPIPAT